MSATKYISMDDSIAQLRAELKREFPGTRFSVKRGRGTGYSWVRVAWTDGPTEADVRAVTRGYEGSGFDGMTDSTYTISHTAADEHGNPVEVHHGIAGINTSRTISPELANQCIARVVKYWGGIESPPVAVANKYGLEGYSLEPDPAWRPIRNDIDLDWHTAIHRASCGQYE